MNVIFELYFESSRIQNFDVWKVEKISILGVVYAGSSQNKIAGNQSGQKLVFSWKILVWGGQILVQNRPKNR